MITRTVVVKDAGLRFDVLVPAERASEEAIGIALETGGTVFLAR